MHEQAWRRERGVRGGAKRVGTRVGARVVVMGAKQTRILNTVAKARGRSREFVVGSALTAPLFVVIPMLAERKRLDRNVGSSSKCKSLTQTKSP